MDGTTIQSIRRTLKECVYHECISMLQDNDPNGDFWAIILEHDHDYDKAMGVLQGCVTVSLSMAIEDKETDAAKFYIKVLANAINY